MGWHSLAQILPDNTTFSGSSLPGSFPASHLVAPKGWVGEENTWADYKESPGQLRYGEILASEANRGTGEQT